MIDGSANSYRESAMPTGGPMESVLTCGWRTIPKMCLLVILGVTAVGKKDIVDVSDGLRGSKTPWLEVLRHLRDRGLSEALLLAIWDGALGFRAALHEIYPQTHHQRCWVHNAANEVGG